MTFCVSLSLCLRVRLFVCPYLFSCTSQAPHQSPSPRLQPPQLQVPTAPVSLPASIPPSMTSLPRTTSVPLSPQSSSVPVSFAAIHAQLVTHLHSSCQTRDLACASNANGWSVLRLDPVTWSPSLVLSWSITTDIPWTLASPFSTLLLYSVIAR